MTSVSFRVNIHFTDATPTVRLTVPPSDCQAEQLTTIHAAFQKLPNVKSIHVYRVVETQEKVSEFRA